MSKRYLSNELVSYVRVIKPPPEFKRHPSPSRPTCAHEHFLQGVATGEGEGVEPLLPEGGVRDAQDCAGAVGL